MSSNVLASDQPDASLPATTDGADRPIDVSLFTSARAKHQPQRYRYEHFRQFGSALAASIGEARAASKEALPAFAPAVFRDGASATKEATERVTMLVCDLDRETSESWANARTTLDASGVSWGAYASPTDGTPKDPINAPERQVKRRLLVPTSRDLTAAESSHLRFLVPKLLGLENDPATQDDESRLFFYGLLGDKQAVLEGGGSGGGVLDVDAFLAAHPLVTAPASDDEERSVHERADIWAANDAHQDAMVPVLAELLAPTYAEGDRHKKIRALGGELARCGWDDPPIERVARALPSDKVEERVVQALDAARVAREGGELFSLDNWGKPLAVRISVIADPHGHMMVYPPTSQVPTQAEHAAQPKHASAEVLRVTSVYANIAPVDWVCEFLRLTAGAPTLLAAYGGTGKTMLVQMLVVCIVTGTPFFGHPVKKGRVRHYDYEQGKRVSLARYQRIAAGMGLPDDALADGLEYVRCGGAEKLSAPGARERLIDECRGITLAVFDCLRSAVAGMNENESTIREPLDLLAEVSDVTSCAMMMIHHNRKPSRENGAARSNENMRGNSAINDAAEVVITLDPRPNGFAVSCGKMRDGKPFKTFSVSIEDAPSPRDANFEGLRLVSVDDAARVRAERDEALAADCNALVTFGRTQPGGALPGREALASKLGMSQRRVRAAIEELEHTKRIITDSTNKKVVTP